MNTPDLRSAAQGVARSESVAFSDVFAPIFEALVGSSASDIVKDAARLAAAHAWEVWHAGVKQRWDEDQIADACYVADIRDGLYESLMIALQEAN